MADEKFISAEDVKALTESNTGEQRVAVAQKISHHYTGTNKRGLSPEQQKMAEEIFRLLAKDADATVRRSLSENLKLDRKIPKDIVRSLANDLEDVAAPMLEFSDVLDDRDLISIIRSAQTRPGHQEAIAKRKNLSEEVSQALIETNIASVARTLFSNDTVKFSDGACQKMLGNFGDNEEVMEALLMKHGLPENLISEMKRRLATNIREQLEKKYKAKLDEMACARYRDRVAVPLRHVEVRPMALEVIKALKAIEKQGSLQLVMALTTGHQDAFLTILSKDANIPMANIRKLYADGNHDAIKKLLAEAEVPDAMIDGVCIMSAVLLEMKHPYRTREDNLDGFQKMYTDAVKERSVGSKGVTEAGYLCQLVEHYTEEEKQRRESRKKKD